jgi:hypothetical protein
MRVQDQFGVVVMRVQNVWCRGLCVAVLIVLPMTAGASDYSNECKSADGVYVVEDGQLFRAADKDRKSKLTYAIVEEQVLEESRGLCFSSNPEARGASYRNVFRKARQVLAIDRPGDTPVRITVMCELAASGLPAAFSCDREQTTMSRKTPGPAVRYTLGSPGTWSHNGSVMRLDADGQTRRLVYMNPRDGLRRVGVSGETTLFDGERMGNTYKGTARWFSATCGEQPFAVTGSVNAEESRIELTGDAPRLDAGCKPAGTRKERLVFERAR